jgi:hypothetical protein
MIQPFPTQPRAPVRWLSLRIFTKLRARKNPLTGFDQMSSNIADRNSSQDHHSREEHRVHGEAASQRGHSGEGAASAMMHMIQQDQKHRHQTLDSREENRAS